MDSYALGQLINQIFVPWIGTISGSVIGITLAVFVFRSLLDFLAGD